MIELSTTGAEAQAFGLALSQVERNTDAKRAALKAVAAAAQVQKVANISTSELFDAIAEGSTDTGQKIMCELISKLTKYLSPWFVTGLLVLGMYQATQSAKSVASFIIDKIKSIGSFLFGSKGEKHDMVRADLSEDLAGAIKFIQGLVVVEMPLVGQLLSAFGEYASAPAPKTKSDMGTEQIDPMADEEEGDVYNPLRHV